jgi:hypothetical protein
VATACNLSYQVGQLFANERRMLCNTASARSVGLTDGLLERNHLSSNLDGP